MADSDDDADTDVTGDDDDNDTDMAAAMAEMEANGDDGDTDMAAAMAEMEASGEAPAAPPPPAAVGRRGRAGGIPAVHDAEVEVAAILGRATMDMSQILKLGRGAIIELNANQDSQVGLYAGDTLIAWGEITVIEDSLAVTIMDMVKSRSR
jgi:flagellar motor switch protein FliN/FliY